MEQTIAELMGADQRRLEVLWAQCLEAIERFDLKAVRELFNIFSQGFRRHIEVEERIFFPAFEAREGADGSQRTAAMCSEHREIAAMIEQLSVLKTARDHSTLTVTVAGQPCDPTTLFQSHNAKEAFLHSMMDAAFAPDERSKLLEQARERLAAKPA
jgi:hypothetical protein